jgi:hypothetical protein
VDRDEIDRLLFGEVLKKFWRGDTDQARAEKRQRIVEEIADYARRVEQGDAMRPRRRARPSGASSSVTKCYAKRDAL